MKVKSNTIVKDGENPMANELVSPKIDVVFKKVFGENNDILGGFLADILEIPITDISELHVVKQELVPDDASGKFCRLDLNLKVKDKLINVEIQLRRQEDYRDRALFYWAKLFTSELKSGEPYGDLKKTITINIMDFNLFEHEQYCCEVVPVVKGTDEIYSDKFGMYFFELRKVTKEIDRNDRKKLWMQFLNANDKEAFDMINQTEAPAIQHAVKLIYDMSEDSMIKEMVRLREKAMHDEASFLATARNEGKAEGRAEGRAEEREKIIAKMKAKGLSDDMIAEYFED